MKKSARAFFSQLHPEENTVTKIQEIYKVSRGNTTNNKNISQEMARSCEKIRKRRIIFLDKFINDGKIQVQSQETHRQPYLVGRRINNNISKTPILETSAVHHNEIERRKSMLERRRISPYLDKHPIPIIKKQKDKSKVKKSFRKRQVSNSKDQKYSVGKRAQISQELLQKSMFDGIQFFRDLGKGAHAVVRSAIDWKNRRKIAVKVYKKCDLNSQELESIKTQILILRSIKHPNIASLYDVIETPKTINLLMEYGGGNSLFQHIRNKPSGFFNQNQAKSLFKQILEAINYLHERNIVHRDIKPQNILINKSNQVKIIDFGFSLISGLQDKVDTFCGTVTYMAPQIVNKKVHVGIYADRWSLGVLLYAMLQGAFPFRAGSEQQLFCKISGGKFEYVVDISVNASRLIERFIVMKPSVRISAKQALDSDWLK